MTLETSKGKTFDAALVTPIVVDRSLLVMIRDAGSRLSQIAADFEGIEWLELEDGRRWNEYTDLRIVYRVDENSVQLRLYREG